MNESYNFTGIPTTMDKPRQQTTPGTGIPVSPPENSGHTQPSRRQRPSGQRRMTLPPTRRMKYENHTVIRAHRLNEIAGLDTLFSVTGHSSKLEHESPPQSGPGPGMDHTSFPRSQLDQNTTVSQPMPKMHHRTLPQVRLRQYENLSAIKAHQLNTIPQDDQLTSSLSSSSLPHTEQEFKRDTDISPAVSSFINYTHDDLDCYPYLTPNEPENNQFDSHPYDLDDEFYDTDSHGYEVDRNQHYDVDEYPYELDSQLSELDDHTYEKIE